MLTMCLNKMISYLIYTSFSPTAKMVYHGVVLGAIHERNLGDGW